MNGPVDLKPDHLMTVMRILAEHVPSLEVRAFGSRVFWTAKDYSDLDLLVVGQRKLDRGTLGRVKEAFEESNLPMQVDVLDWHDISESFRREIKRDYMVLQEGQSDARVEWPNVDLADADLEIIDGDRGKNYPKQHDLLESGHCLFLNAGNVTKEGFNFSSCTFISSDRDQRLGKGKVALDDVVLTTRGTLGNTAHLGEAVPYQHVRINSGMVILRASKAALDPRFLFLVTRSPQFRSQVQSLSTGSAQPQLPIRDIEQISIPLPPLRQQRAIAHLLGTLDEKIELNRRMNETLESMARSLFKSWFVDFEPVRAKMEGRWRPGESLPGLPTDLYDLFPDRLEPSELGEVPEGWEVKTLGDVIEFKYGKALRSADRRGGSVPVFGSNGQIGSHNERLVSGPGIIVGRKGNPGVVTWSHGDFFPIDTTFYVVPRFAIVALPFLYYALSGQDLPAVSADSAVPGLNRNLAYMNQQLVPDLQLITIFNDYATFIFSLHHRLAEESRTIAAQQDTLLPKLVSGEVQVGEANTAVG